MQLVYRDNMIRVMIPRILITFAIITLLVLLFASCTSTSGWQCEERTKKNAVPALIYPSVPL